MLVLDAGSQTVCNTPLAAVIDKTGYWSSTDQKNVWEIAVNLYDDE